MKELFEFIKGKILAGVPQVKTVRMYNNQISQMNTSRKEKPMAFPAVLVEFITEEVQNFSLGIKNVRLTVRFRFAIEGYTFERLQNLDFQDDFDGVIQSLRGNETDPVQFSTMQEQVNELDEDFDNVQQPYIDYSTIFRKKSAYARRHDTIITGVNVKISLFDPNVDTGIFDKSFGVEFE